MTIVDSADQLHYSAIGLLAKRYNNGTFLRTGAVVGNNIILTVGHNLSSSRVSSKPREIRFISGKHGGRGLPEPTISSFEIREEYKASNYEDYGIIVVN
jgi:V8-like Glu-specific endopeptidase